MESIKTIEAKAKQAGLTGSFSYEIFMVMVSMLSFVNIVLILLPLSEEVNKIVYTADYALAAIFLFDFLTRFFTAKSKKKYFFKQYGWADFLASIPLTGFNVFRLFRIVKVVRITNIIGVKPMITLLRRSLAHSALYGVFFLIILVLEFGAIAVYMAEHRAVDANIINASDAIWWTFVSITTVGYGDYYPVTNAGRMVGVVTLTVGVGLFGVVTGFLANVFLRPKKNHDD